MLFKNLAENETERLVPGLKKALERFKKLLHEVKANGLQPSFNIF